MISLRLLQRTVVNFRRNREAVCWLLGQDGLCRPCVVSKGRHFCATSKSGRQLSEEQLDDFPKIEESERGTVTLEGLYSNLRYLAEGIPDETQRREALKKVDEKICNEDLHRRPQFHDRGAGAVGLCAPERRAGAAGG